MNEHIMNLLRVFLKRSVQIKSVLFAEGIQNRMCEAGFVRAGLPAQNSNRAFIDGKRWIRDYQFFRELHFISQAETLRTRAEGIIKGKTSWLNFLNTDPAVRAGKALAEIQRFAVDHIYYQKSFCQMEHTLHRIRQPFLNSRTHNQAVHNNFNIVFNIFLQSDVLGQFIHISIYADTYISAALCMLQKLCMSAFAAAHYRSQKLDPCPLRKRHNLIHHLIHSLLCDLPAAFRAVRNTNSRIKKPEIVVDLRHSSHGRTGIVVC